MASGFRHGSPSFTDPQELSVHAVTIHGVSSVLEHAVVGYLYRAPRSSPGLDTLSS